MPYLAGFCNPLGFSPAFLIPLFADRHRGNRIFVQDISPSDTIRAFHEIDAGSDITVGDHPEKQIGESAYWAFQLNKGEVIQGTAAKVSERLRSLLRRGEFDHLPWLKTEVAFFCEDEIVQIEALRVAYQNLSSHSVLSANIWRDNIVLLPMVKRELAQISAPMSNFRVEYLDQVKVHSSDSELFVRIPSILRTERTREGPLFAATHRFAKALGVPDLRIIEFSTPPPERKGVARYGVLFGQGTIGSKISGTPNAGKLHGVPVFSSGSSPSERQSFLSDYPLFAFTVMNSDERHIRPALNFAARWPAETIKVAIAMQPIGFGTRRKDRLDISDLEQLKDRYDYVFLIGNHTLSKPRGVAPSLTASHRGMSFARNCIKVWMDLSNAFNNAKAIRQSFQSEGLALFGMAHIGPEENIETAREHASRQMLHENLPLESATETVVVQPRFGKVMVRRATRPDDEAITIVRQGARKTSLVAHLAFGIRPVPLSPARFALFSRALLRAHGWSLREEGDTFFVGNKDTGRSKIFSTLLHAEREYYPEQLVAEIRSRNNVLPIVLITNFTPSQKLQSLFGINDGLVLHYSRLSEISS